MTTPASATSTSIPSQPRVVPSEVGWQFVPQYYTFVNKQPGRLHCFYTKNSTFIHGTEGEDGKPCYGQHEIHSKILSIGFQDCKVYIHSVDAQSSANGGIIIQVIGEMSNKGEPWRKFVQTFFLAEQPNGYFVLNDIFRFLREEEPVDEEEEEQQPQEVQYEAPAPPAVEETLVPTPALEEPLITAEDAAIVPEPAPAVAAEASTVPNPAQQSRADPPPQLEPHLTNGVTHVKEESPAPESIEPLTATAVEPEPVATELEAAPVESSPAPPAVDTPPRAPSPPVASTPEPAAAAPTPAPAPAAEKPAQKKPDAPAAPAAPPKPAAPKTWASLAAVNSKSWGAAVAADSKGVSTAAANAPVTPITPKPRQNAPSAPTVPTGNEHPAAAAAKSVTTAQCFVKSVQENVPEKALREVLVARFGPIKELEIVRSKACAFLEFASLDSARRAILASLPTGQGGEGGIWIAEGAREPPAGGFPRDVPRITVETRKERSERGPPRPRTGPPNGDGRGGFRGGAGAGAGRGRGGAGRGAAAGSK